MIILHHIIPVICFSLIFNITKFISISPVGPSLQMIPQYLKFILFFQVFHPLTTTGVLPLLLLIILNYKVQHIFIFFLFCRKKCTQIKKRSESSFCLAEKVTKTSHHYFDQIKKRHFMVNKNKQKFHKKTQKKQSKNRNKVSMYVF